jgi:hypothetical protein
MNAFPKPTSLPAPARAIGPGRRAAGVFVLLVMLGACIFFWVGIPIGGLYLLGRVLDSPTTHFVAGLIGVPVAMVAFAPVLFWLNGLYLRVTGVLARLEADDEEYGWSSRVSGPLEPMLFLSLAIALVALAVWFFAFAHDPPRILI